MDKYTEYALTTIDNPYDPFKDFDEWYRFDCDKGYYSCAYLARVAALSDKLSDQEAFDAVRDAIDEIIAVDPFNIYRRVSREVSFDDIHPEDVSTHLTPEQEKLIKKSIELSNKKQEARRNGTKKLEEVLLT